MLVELRIENFAIIDKVELELGSGLTVFTGETGAGKSIIIDAVETLLGVRADMTNIRTGVTHSSVEATFKIMPKVREQVHQILREEALLDDENADGARGGVPAQDHGPGRLLGEVIAEAKHISIVSATPAIDALILVADHTNVAVP